MLKDIAQITEEIRLNETGEVEIRYYNLHGEKTCRPYKKRKE